MTLCIAWIREAGEDKELVFATDSTLTGGETWNHGVKLFELPRTDCLICFAGETQRAYPLILNLISSLKHNEKLNNPALDIKDVVKGIVDLFNELINSIFDVAAGLRENVGGEAKFLFGGWSWKVGRFKIWYLYYSPEYKKFISVDKTEEEKKSKWRVAIGDPDDTDYSITQIADQRYRDLVRKLDRDDDSLDMEPLSVLVDMCLDTTIRDVGGSVQIGKVYKSGTTEFFGIMWQSAFGNPHFLGKSYEKHNKPRVRYYNPDNSQLIEEAIPKNLDNIEDFCETDDYDFLKECYSQEDNFLKTNISELERVKLISIFREFAYNDFLKNKAEVNRNLLPRNTEEPKDFLQELDRLVLEEENLKKNQIDVE